MIAAVRDVISVLAGCIVMQRPPWSIAFIAKSLQNQRKPAKSIKLFR
jgi:hypothetical protein